VVAEPRRFSNLTWTVLKFSRPYGTHFAIGSHSGIGALPSARRSCLECFRSMGENYCPGEQVPGNRVIAFDGAAPRLFRPMYAWGVKFRDILYILSPDILYSFG
jgi:hypothetical protein